MRVSVSGSLADFCTPDVVWQFTWVKMSASSKPRVEVSGNTWALKRPCWMLQRSSLHTGKSVVTVGFSTGHVDSYLIRKSPLCGLDLTINTEVCSCGTCGDSATSMSRLSKMARSYPGRDAVHEK